ncbi:DUF488 family protein [Gracilibacillus oryzae]|uniref:DUF488 family protein n=1 Tax=Gracilibacillus oryzae TaxID=1672701 RepID=A0A7C8GQ43_9BACI|nr:DUF488 family protein [Gracilibacillus oryzae]KAB8125894.1 DUF488 family protein [Gracilibacillus oryzae]
MQIKRVYEIAKEEDNVRILVDRIWPRGISKEKAYLNDWLKELGPSHELRKWFAHDPDKFDEFRKKYLHELEKDEEKREAFQQLRNYYEANNGNITLVFAAKEMEYNHVNVLKEKLESK